MVSATSDLLISGKASLLPSAYNRVTRLVSTEKPASAAEISLAAMISNFLDCNFFVAFSNRSRDSAAKPTTIAGRTRSRAQQLADQFGGRAVDWQARHNVEVDVIVNCTPIGMHPNVDETPFGKSYLKPAMVVFDTVYNPESTLLLKEAKSHGCRTVTGVEMFIRQAALQFMLFTGREAPYQLMRETLKRAIGPVKF